MSLQEPFSMSAKGKLPESRASKLDAEISERTQRIFSGSAGSGDYSALHRLVVEKAETVLVTQDDVFTAKLDELLKRRKLRRRLFFSPKGAASK